MSIKPEAEHQVGEESPATARYFWVIGVLGDRIRRIPDMQNIARTPIKVVVKLEPPDDPSPAPDTLLALDAKNADVEDLLFVSSRVWRTSAEAYQWYHGPARELIELSANAVLYSLTEG